MEEALRAVGGLGAVHTECRVLGFRSPVPPNEPLYDNFGYPSVSHLLFCCTRTGKTRLESRSCYVIFGNYVSNLKKRNSLYLRGYVSWEHFILFSPITAIKNLTKIIKIKIKL